MISILNSREYIILQNNIPLRNLKPKCNLSSAIRQLNTSRPCQNQNKIIKNEDMFNKLIGKHSIYFQFKKKISSSMSVIFSAWTQAHLFPSHLFQSSRQETPDCLSSSHVNTVCAVFCGIFVFIGIRARFISRISLAVGLVCPAQYLVCMVLGIRCLVEITKCLVFRFLYLWSG